MSATTPLAAPAPHPAVRPVLRRRASSAHALLRPRVPGLQMPSARMPSAPMLSRRMPGAAR